MIALGVLLVVALVGWFAFDFLRDRLQASDCDSTTRVAVVAAPDIAPAVAQVGRRVSEQADAGCYRVSVAARESAAVAESLVVSDGTERPDVWVPESTMWLRRAQDAGAWNTPVQGTSIATSPVVLALTEDAANRLGWPRRTLDWSQVIGPSATRLTIGIADPARDPTGAAALLGVDELVAGADDPGAAKVAALRRLSANTVSAASDLFTRLPGTLTAAEPLDGFPTSENAVLRHNARQSQSSLVAAYADPAVPALDYPFVVLPRAPDATRDAAERFLGTLTGRDSASVFADAGFRTPEGTVLRDRSGDRRSSALARRPQPWPGGIDETLNSWAAVNLSGRLQVLLDVSGSMNEPVPGTARTRMAVTVDAATRGIGLFKPTTKLGLWLFSTRIDGERDYRQLLPVRTVSEQLAAGALDTLRSVQALPSGNTALYDTVLAAYRDAHRHWEPGRINTVVVLTDGQDDNASDITRRQLLAELGKLRDPRRPLAIVGIGIGPDADRAELTAIAKATGGQAFTAPNPARIGEVFYAALSRMLCQPPACDPPSGGG
ncbi:substrate-binding and VWA domain-containing protein [Actinophytocola sp.]|uniref:substrate-binding and VWA domain-containing protein n=1 Tax=Actinophytocola sp. TaxID=1872138 RepID=UPI003D6B42A6